MEKVWLKNYQKGVPYHIDPDAYASLVDIFEESCRKYNDKPAFINMGKTLTYGDMDEQTAILARFFQFELGLQKGDRIAIMMPNILQYPVALFAALRLGLWVVNVNPLYTARELEHIVKDSGVNTLIVLANFAHTVSEVLVDVSIKNIIVTDIGDMLGFFKGKLVNFVVRHVKEMVPPYHIPRLITWKRAMALGRKQWPEDKKTNIKYHFEKPILTGEDIAFLQYTGGTTGQTKAACLTHRNMVANLEQASAWIKPATMKGKEIIITALPLYHVFSLTANCLVFFKIGALNVLITNPRDINGFIREMSKFQFTTITGVNTLFNALLNNSRFKTIDFTHLSLALGGGMTIQKAVAEKWQKLTKIPLLEAYGLTETSPAVCINPLNIKAYNGSIGLPIPSTEISIRDDEGNELSFGEPGELWVKGPQVMKEYWQQPEETKKALTEDGWLKTGDIATVDREGFVRIVDRKKDMIVVSGFNVYPNEIEDVIAMMPGVFEVVVIGIPYHDSERVKAYIIKRDPKLTESDILEHCHKYLTPYKIPKAIEFRKELPKTPVGKILRRALREELLQNNATKKFSENKSILAT